MSDDNLRTGEGAFPPYTALISLYAKEKPEYLHESMASVFAQTVQPEQIVVVKDGPLTSELDMALEEYDAEHPNLFTFISYSENKGLWYALRQGIPACRNEFIMRMDTDDYSLPTRAETQLTVYARHPELGCVGSVVVEFSENISNPVSFVDLPELDAEIRKFGKKRCPFRHPTLMYRKSAVERAGNYQQMPTFEDYDLYMRLASAGCRFYNIQKPLVYVRSNPDFFARRGGMAYMHNMMHFETTCLRRSDISFFEYLATVVPRVAVCLMPNSLRTSVYTRFLRKPVEERKLA
jgi:glycosyltransferase involved in cell wall biosynthesis